MRTSRWRYVAHGLAAASLCLAAIGCGDDTGGDDMGDLGMRDLTANDDMPVEDMTAAAQPSGLVVAADVVGVFHIAPTSDGGSEQNLPFTHMVLAQPQFPMAGDANPDYTDLNIAGVTISGCTANRYDLASPSAHQPTRDIDVGTVTIGRITTGGLDTTGWESYRFGAPGPTAQDGLLAPPQATSAACTRGANGFYGCNYTTTTNGALVTASGRSLTSVIFAPMTQTNWNNLCNIVAPTDLSNCRDACDTRNTDLNTLLGGPACEQRMLYTRIAGVDGGAAGGSTLGFDVPGGAPFGAVKNSVDVRAAARITGMKKGTTAITLTSGTLEDLQNQIDKNQDLSISWSCDGSTTTGAGCSPGLIVVALIGQTSLAGRGAFATPSPQYGTLTCLENTTSTITVKSQALKTMIGSQSGGSLNLNLVRLQAGFGGIGSTPKQLHAGGVGQFVFTDL